MTTTTTILYELVPDPESLMGEAFTLTELRTLHESRLGVTLKRDTFNRRMLPYLTVEGTDVATGGRPALTYRVNPEASHAPIWRLPRA